MDYYNRKYIGFNMLESAKSREFCFLPAFRLGQIRSLNELNSLLDLVNWDKRRLNAYVSCSKFKNILNFTFDIKKRSKFTSQWFDNEMIRELVETDIFFDFDSSDIELARQDTKKLKEFLDDFQVPYWINFSGNRGYHVLISGSLIQDFTINEMSVYPHKTFIENVKEFLDLKTLDLANNSLVNHLRKCEYSLVLPKKYKDNPELCPESLMNVALPLSDEQFDNFNITDMLLFNVLKKVKLIRRGNLERFSHLSLEQKKKNLIKLLKEFRAYDNNINKEMLVLQ